MKKQTRPTASLIGSFLLAVSCSTSSVLAAESLRCPSLFSSNMVLQRDKQVPLWGWAEPGTKVTVQFAKQHKSATAAKNGRWDISLDNLTTSAQNRNLTVSAGKEKLTFDNVLVGEVWVASGQSNMQWTLPGSSMTAEQIKSLNEPMIRMITVPRVISPTPMSDVKASWVTLDAKSAPGASAVASYFAMKLRQELNVPIGVISTSWGGTRIEPWTPAKGFDPIPELKQLADGIRAMNPKPSAQKQETDSHIAAVKAWLKNAEADASTGRIPTKIPVRKVAKINNRTPGALYNAMIHPFIGSAIRGAIWYQGESNMGEGLLYEKKMQALIRGWRSVWGQGDFPFYHVQLAPYGSYSGEKLGGIWEAQYHSIQSIKNTGMAVTTDIGNLKNIHPKNKLDVGNRLAFWALAKDYGKKIPYSGPLYKGYAIKGNKVIISFDHAETGLSFKGKEITDVFIKGQGDTAFVKAQPTIDGSTLVVTHPEGKKPLHVRMGWNTNAQPNLINKHGLPATPFRTDQGK
jgi:sialate O-acetylesterase